MTNSDYNCSSIFYSATVKSLICPASLKHRRAVSLDKACLLAFCSTDARRQTHFSQLPRSVPLSGLICNLKSHEYLCDKYANVWILKEVSFKGFWIFLFAYWLWFRYIFSLVMFTREYFVWTFPIFSTFYIYLHSKY